MSNTTRLVNAETGGNIPFDPIQLQAWLVKYMSEQYPSIAELVTPSDTAELSDVLFLRVGGSGNLKITDQDDNDTTLTTLSAGETILVRAKKVWDTGTSCTNIVAFKAKSE